MKWVTCKTGRSRSNRKTLTLKEKIGLHTQIQKNSFPIENLTLSEQTCETNNIIQSSQWFVQSFVVAKAPVIWIPSTWVFESWWILLKIRNGSSYNIYIYIKICWLMLVESFLRKLFGGNYLGKVFRGGLQLSGYLSFLKTKWKVLVIRREKMIQINLNRKDAGTNV